LLTLLRPLHLARFSDRFHLPASRVGCPMTSTIKRPTSCWRSFKTQMTTCTEIASSPPCAFGLRTASSYSSAMNWALRLPTSRLYATLAGAPNHVKRTYVGSLVRSVPYLGCPCTANAHTSIMQARKALVSSPFLPSPTRCISLRGLIHSISIKRHPLA
jgi:hypothetical protein